MFPGFLLGLDCHHGDEGHMMPLPVMMVNVMTKMMMMMTTMGVLTDNGGDVHEHDDHDVTFFSVLGIVTRRHVLLCLYSYWDHLAYQ